MSDEREKLARKDEDPEVEAHRGKHVAGEQPAGDEPATDADDADVEAHNWMRRR